MYNGSITDVAGLLIGHAHDIRALTGVTVAIAPGGAVCGVDVRGSAPGTRETDLLSQARTVQKADAIMLAGGSAFGLAAADGVMTWCERRDMGVETAEGRIPIVPAAVIYDLAYGSKTVRPNAAMGYAACANAGKTVRQGSIGAGIGATVGKTLGMRYCQKGGIGTASLVLPGGVTVGALMCVNAFGDVLDGGKIVAGAYFNGRFIGSADYLMQRGTLTGLVLHSNTTIGVVATDARLAKDEAAKLAQTAHDGLARAIDPVHTVADGDTVFALSYGKKKGDLAALCAAAAEAARRAVVNAVLSVKGTDL